ncbi:hypothetical protein [Streptomyces xiaopingdaonensis]|uniref:hypothetical protein n=1 Tax=Streptomyces xiaopingdaonensis TaxID=1565415 RepID=UPI00031ED028|nr:hypothetical protein [Streptomyces xiaopingdaonensis]
MTEGRNHEDVEAPKTDSGIDNQISGGQFNGPVGQFGAVHGDVNYQWSAPPKSQRELEFRARYMRKAEEAWAAEEKKREAEEEEENRHPAEKILRGVVLVILQLAISALFIFLVFRLAPHVLEALSGFEDAP